ncbi:hypothetical protein [Nitrospirillum iridis]|uniref:Uncharacterized protein n=1 Tax=Nitrospirillum iridis TaxID=765888 RepID=A0A7X0AY46_9PROT|nr:hypothetical protein [Nitrospirillum iridis]MBB6251456.1 hypothetical protein [Nitrospirillum iridis]
MAAANPSITSDPAVQQAEADLDRQLAQGAHQIVIDATGRRVDRASFPVGRVPAGMTLVQFWRLDFPIAGQSLNYDDPAVQHLLQDMLSIRRLDAGGLTALLSRIRRTLLDAYGTAKGGLMAAALMARCQQAIERPEDFPPLLSDDELRTGYTATGRIAKGFHYGAWVNNAAAAESNRARVVGSTWLPAWLRETCQALSRGPATPINLMFIYIGKILGTGEDYNNARHLAYRDEMNRRRMAIP